MRIVLIFACLVATTLATGTVHDLVDLHRYDNVTNLTVASPHLVTIKKSIDELATGSTAVASSDNKTFTRYRFNHLAACGQHTNQTYVTYNTESFIANVFNEDTDIKITLALDDATETQFIAKRFIVREMQIPVSETNGAFCLSMGVATTGTPTSLPTTVNTTEAPTLETKLRVGIEMSKTNWILTGVTLFLGLVALVVCVGVLVSNKYNTEVPYGYRQQYPRPYIFR